MPRILKVAAAQVGAVHTGADRSSTLQRLIKLLDQAAEEGAQIVLFPELASTTFFPRHLFKNDKELDKLFEHGDDVSISTSLKPFFDRAKEVGVDIAVGFAERSSSGNGYNTCVYYCAAAGRIINKYRKIHLPGTKEPFENKDAINQLEKRYFEPGDLGFHAFRAPNLVSAAVKAGSQEKDTTGKGDPIVGMMICNDRRWPEAWRCLALQGVELVLCGYNTAGWAPDLWGTRKHMTKEQAEEEALFHHRLVMQANSYMNSCFSISAARCGLDDGKYDLIGGSSVVSPEGHILAEAKGKGDELVVAEIDLEECQQGKSKVRFHTEGSFVYMDDI